MGELAKLTDIRIRNAKPQDKPVKLSDGGGLSLLIKPDGSRYWRYNYRFHGKQQRTMALGVYPVVSAKEARERHQAARAQLAQGVDPMAERKVAKLIAANDMAEDFDAVARALWASKLRAGRSAGYGR